MPTQNPREQQVVRVKSPEELEVERLLAEIEQRKATVADLELEIETLKIRVGAV